MQHWDAVLFDFDGVILDSVNIKTEAFRKLFEQYGKTVSESAVSFHLKMGGISRFVKFDHIYKQILNKPLTPEMSLELGKLFSSIVFEKIMESSFIPGAFNALTALVDNPTPAFVVSGTPEGELKEIITIRDLQRFFVEVHGSPRNKPEIINSIIHRKQYVRENVLFIGDAITDYKAAKETKIKFLGILSASGTNPFPKKVLASSSVFIP